MTGQTNALKENSVCDSRKIGDASSSTSSPRNGSLLARVSEVNQLFQEYAAELSLAQTTMNVRSVDNPNAGLPPNRQVFTTPSANNVVSGVPIIRNIVCDILKLGVGDGNETQRLLELVSSSMTTLSECAANTSYFAAFPETQCDIPPIEQNFIVPIGGIRYQNAFATNSP